MQRAVANTHGSLPTCHALGCCSAPPCPTAERFQLWTQLIDSELSCPHQALACFTMRLCVQGADARKIEEFLTRHVPNAVLIGTANIHCKQLRDDFQLICDHILEHNPQAR